MDCQGGSRWISQLFLSVQVGIHREIEFNDSKKWNASAFSFESSLEFISIAVTVQWSFNEFSNGTYGHKWTIELYPHEICIAQWLSFVQEIREQAYIID